MIAAHNELENHKRFLLSVLNQDYPEFEVILILDRCTDGSREWLNSLAQSHLVIEEIKTTPDGWSPKKWAIQRGIQRAKYDHLAFTDADCEVNQNWLQEVNGSFGEQKEVILGLGPYFREKGLLNAFIQYETLYTAFQFVGFARLGLPYMGLGRNLAYRKSFFLDNGGFKGVENSLSGDDDLLINAYAKPRQTTVLISPESRVFSIPKKIFRDYIRQKWRHVSASGHYSFLSKLILGIFHTSHLLFYLLTLIGIVWGGTTKPFIFLYIGKTIFSWSLFMLLQKKHEMGKLAYPWPVLDFLYFIYNLSVVPIGLIRKPTWI